MFICSDFVFQLSYLIFVPFITCRYTEIKDRRASFDYFNDLITSLLHATQVSSHLQSFNQALVREKDYNQKELNKKWLEPFFRISSVHSICRHLVSSQGQFWFASTLPSTTSSQRPGLGLLAAPPPCKTNSARTARPTWPRLS